MSGHSKWATTKHRKAAQDAKRSALFSKLSRNITVAAKEGGDPNPDNNASLAAAIEKAKATRCRRTRSRPLSTRRSVPARMPRTTRPSCTKATARAALPSTARR